MLRFTDVVNIEQTEITKLTNVKINDYIWNN